MQRYTGSRVQRVEDPRILTGRGRYVDDLQLPHMVHAAFCRSPFPHARILSIDTSEAEALPGVVAVYTAADIDAHPLALQYVPEGFEAPAYTALATDKVRLVGDTVVLVVAESRALAEDACELVVIDYEELPGVGTIDESLDPSSAPLWDDIGHNIVWRDSQTYGDVDAAFAGAHRVVEARFDQHRQSNVPMEPRGMVMSFDPATGELTYHSAIQGPAMSRVVLAGILGLPAHLVRVVNGDVGGSFGQKSYIRHEDVAVAWASRALGRPVKWIEDRAENLTVGGQAREERVDASVAVDADGRILGLKFAVVLDQGAYPLSGVGSNVFTTVMRVMLPQAYRIEHLQFDTTIVFSNKASYVAYRGPWEMETFVRERLLDLVARELGIEPAEVRRRNLLTDDEMPRDMITGPTLSGITMRRALDKAEEVAGWAGFREEQERARAQGRHLGLGVATFIEAAPGPPNYGPAVGFAVPPERARARLEPDGTVTIYTAQNPHGQGHETTLAQLAADTMGVPIESVKVRHGDTAFAPFSMMGTGGSRAATVASGAAIGATRLLRDRVASIVANFLEASPDDIEIVDGVASVRGMPTAAFPLAQVAMTAYLAPHMLPPGMEQGMDVTFDFASGEGGWTQSVHTCCVEVDAETGVVRILRYVVVEDCGQVINPGIVEGQVLGGVAMGVAGVLLEKSAYEADGSFRSSTFMDYLLPTASEVPAVEIHHLEQLGDLIDGDFRGVGEGGAIGAPAALTSAIEDALSPFGVRITEQYLPPSRILELIGAIPTD